MFHFKKNIFSILFIFSIILNLFAVQYEIPKCTTQDDHQIVSHLGYTLCYRESFEQAEWVAYELTVSELQKVATRGNNFRSDAAITTFSATPEDYRSSGFDRGHLAPAADMSWSKEAMSESFFMSNMSPQAPSFNRGIWSKLENQVRQLVLSHGRLFVVTGPILEKTDYPVIGINKVAVPEYFYKVLLFIPDDYTEQAQSIISSNIDSDKSNLILSSKIHAIGFILPNQGSSSDVYDFAVPVDEVETRTGIDFFYLLDDSIENLIESNSDFSFWQF